MGRVRFDMELRQVAVLLPLLILAIVPSVRALESGTQGAITMALQPGQQRHSPRLLRRVAATPRLRRATSVNPKKAPTGKTIACPKGFQIHGSAKSLSQASAKASTWFCKCAKCFDCQHSDQTGVDVIALIEGNGPSADIASLESLANSFLSGRYQEVLGISTQYNCYRPFS